MWVVVAPSNNRADRTKKKATSFTVADLFKKRVDNYTQEIKQALKHVGVASDMVEAIQVAPTDDDVSGRLIVRNGIKPFGSVC